MNRYIYVVLAAWLATPAFSATQSDTEERIRRIQQGLAPPVLVQGETLRGVLSHSAGLTRLQPFIADLGALKGLTFKSVGDNGADEYDADFEKGALRIYMALDEQGLIAGVNFVPR